MQISVLLFAFSFLLPSTILSYFFDNIIFILCRNETFVVIFFYDLCIFYSFPLIKCFSQTKWIWVWAKAKESTRKPLKWLRWIWVEVFFNGCILLLFLLWTFHNHWFFSIFISRIRQDHAFLFNILCSLLMLVLILVAGFFFQLWVFCLCFFFVIHKT